MCQPERGVTVICVEGWHTGWVGTPWGARRARGGVNRPEICEAPEGGGEKTQGHARQDIEIGYHAIQDKKIRESAKFSFEEYCVVSCSRALSAPSHRQYLVLM